MLVMNFPWWLLILYFLIKALLLIIPLMIIMTKKRDYFLIYYLIIFIILFLFNLLGNSFLLIFLTIVWLIFAIVKIWNIGKEKESYTKNTKYIILILGLFQIFMARLFWQDYFRWNMWVYFYVIFIPWIYFIMEIIRDVD